MFRGRGLMAVAGAAGVWAVVMVLMGDNNGSKPRRITLYVSRDFYLRKQYRQYFNNDG